MSLFFYGIVQIKDDQSVIMEHLSNLGHERGWHIEFGDIDGFSPKDLFELTMDSIDYVLFEVKANNSKIDDVYDLIYGDFGGDKMVAHYRAIAHDLGLHNWDTLEFGEDEAVNNVYQKKYVNLPVNTFILDILLRFNDREVTFSLDQDFENRFSCKDVVGTAEDLLREIWMTIAFGFTWPNIRLTYLPNNSR